MRRDPPDAATLDALVTGADDGEDAEAWEWLVATPGSEAQWSAAVARRKRIDRFAAALASHPWLATVLAQVRRARGRSGSVQAWIPRDLLTAQLGPGEKEPSRLAESSWGHVETVAVRVGTTVELRAGGGAAVSTFYKTQRDEGALPGHRWRLEPGEAPVLLVAVADPGGTAGSMEEALRRGAAAAGILLVQAEDGV